MGVILTTYIHWDDPLSIDRVQEGVRADGYFNGVKPLEIAENTSVKHWGFFHHERSEGI